MASTAGQVAVQATATAEAANRPTYPASTSQVAADFRNPPFWTPIISKARSLFPAPRQSEATNVSASETGIIMAPTSTEGARLDVTGISPIPPTRRVYVSTTDVSAFTFRVQWRDVIGDVFNETTTASGVCVAPAQASSYSVAIERASGLDPVTATNATVFEVIGSNGMYVSPDGISVEVGGIPVNEISPNLPVPVAPTAPTITSAGGVVVIHWAGTMSSGSVPTNFQYVYAQESPNGSTGWTRVGQPLTGFGDISRSVPVGSVRYYRLIARDNLGRDGVPSSNAGPLTVSGVGLGDMDSTVADAIANAQTTADGKNRIVVSTTAPTLPGTPPFVAGDQWWIRHATDPNQLTGVKVFNGSAWTNYLMVADTIIVPGSAGTTVIADGAVTTAKVVAGAITTNELAPSVGGTLDISANGSINILVGVQDEHTAAIAANADDVATLDSTLTTTTATAITAASTASGAAEAAASAATTANAANTAIQNMGQTYRFTEAGAYIGAPGSPYEFVLDNTGAEIRYGGIMVSKWDAGSMIVPSFVGTKVIVGNHQIEKYTGAAGGTVVKLAEL
jgi:hypothetical protein